MSLLIDTNVAIYLRDGVPQVVQRLIDHGARPAISLVTLIELQGGIYSDPLWVNARAQGLRMLLARTQLKPLGEAEVSRYGSIVARLGFSRRRILDRLIAATAINNDLTLVTMNGDDFRDIPDLQLEVWPSPQ